MRCKTCHFIRAGCPSQPQTAFRSIHHQNHTRLLCRVGTAQRLLNDCYPRLEDAPPNVLLVWLALAVSIQWADVPRVAALSCDGDEPRLPMRRAAFATTTANTKARSVCRHRIASPLDPLNLCHCCLQVDSQHGAEAKQAMPALLSSCQPGGAAGGRAGAVRCNEQGGCQVVGACVEFCHTSFATPRCSRCMVC